MVLTLSVNFKFCLTVLISQMTAVLALVQLEFVIYLLESAHPTESAVLDDLIKVVHTRVKSAA